ncbi:hypothetical protein WMY93_015558 [Mugilogobius chulae]|uniref:Uncharacterized protein n=1 Tax=Mugilogobius chulae TaxID=88201 RepID=A0AAW0P0R9_9GOBI
MAHHSLLKQIKDISEEAASELKSADFKTDEDIRSLNRQDLLELLPGKKNLKCRKQIYELIHTLPRPNNKGHSIDNILKDIRGLISPDSIANALLKMDHF